jgi:hypothetical protein
MKTGIKKIIIIVLMVWITLFLTHESVQSIELTLLAGLISFISGLILTPLIKINSLYYSLIIENPRWSDKMDQRKPLIFMQFLAYLLLTAGISELIYVFAKRQIFSFLGMVILLAGLGVLAGMYITLLTNKSKNNKPV